MTILFFRGYGCKNRHRIETATIIIIDDIHKTLQLILNKIKLENFPLFPRMNKAKNYNDIKNNINTHNSKNCQLETQQQEYSSHVILGDYSKTNTPYKSVSVSDGLKSCLSAGDCFDLTGVETSLMWRSGGCRTHGLTNGPYAFVACGRVAKLVRFEISGPSCLVWSKDVYLPYDTVQVGVSLTQ